MRNEQKIQYISTAELAKLLHVSRIAVFKKIQSGKIKAFKIGRNYVIPIEEVMSAIGTFISTDKKSEIDNVVKRAVKEYGETLRLLGEE
ncbi:MAG: helix-turn-helix domain-containing protein [Candidatus Taylorbacteria bacterium]